jgi:endonuclease-3
MQDKDLSARIAQTLRLLREAYGPAPRDRPDSAVDSLVATILSQNTSRANSEAGFRGLKQGFADWQQVADAAIEEIRRCIQVSGLAGIKAPRIRKILREIARQRGEIDLEFLSDLPAGKAREYLLGFEGIGPKTASCILLFAFEMDVFPVDTHIHRIARRLEWIAPEASAEKTHELLAPHVAPGACYDLHVLLIQHGRQTCKARNPRCRLCCLREHCPFLSRANQRASETSP